MRENVVHTSSQAITHKNALTLCTIEPNWWAGRKLSDPITTRIKQNWIWFDFFWCSIWNVSFNSRNTINPRQSPLSQRNIRLHKAHTHIRPIKTRWDDSVRRRRRPQYIHSHDTDRANLLYFYFTFVNGRMRVYEWKRKTEIKLNDERNENYCRRTEATDDERMKNGER